MFGISMLTFNGSDYGISPDDSFKDNENKESRKKAVPKLAFWEKEYPEPVEK